MDFFTGLAVGAGIVAPAVYWYLRRKHAGVLQQARDMEDRLRGVIRKGGGSGDDKGG